MAEPKGIEKGRCWSCAWFAQQDGFEGGQCWRFPPVPSAHFALDGSGASHFENLRPYVGKNEGCGEYRNVCANG